jgi:hypothetical protein
MAKVRCPSCKAAVETSGGPGAVVDCDECGKKFRLAAPKAAAAAGAPRRSAAPPDDEEDDDEPVVTKPKKNKKRKKSAGLPPWLLPAAGGVTFLTAAVLTIVFVIVPTMKRGILFDVMKAISDDHDSIAVVRPKAVSGASGISAMAEQMKGGGSHYAPTPPEGYGYEPGHVTEAIHVKKGLKSFYILRFGWAARPTTPAVAFHRDVPIREDKPKHLEKPRYVVTGRDELALFESVDDAKAGIDRMLDSKKAGYYPQPKAAAYFTRAPGKMQDVFTTGMGPEIDRPKTVSVELSYKDYDYAVTYTLDYGSPEAVSKALKSIEECNKKVREEMAEWRKANPYAEQDPFTRVDRLMHLPKEAQGNTLVMRNPFSNASSGPAMPLINECFRMGDNYWAGAEDLLGGVGK